jgi:hypothetical protein
VAKASCFSADLHVWRIDRVTVAYVGRSIELGASNDKMDLAVLSASRRTSVVGIVAAALGAAIAAPNIAKAGKVGKKVKKKCKSQEAPCVTFGYQVCGALIPSGGDALSNCLTAMTQCCVPLTRCDADSFFPCISAALTGLVPV